MRKIFGLLSLFGFLLVTQHLFWLKTSIIDGGSLVASHGSGNAHWLRIPENMIQERRVFGIVKFGIPPRIVIIHGLLVNGKQSVGNVLQNELLLYRMHKVSYNR